MCYLIKAIIWGIGETYNRHSNLIKYYWKYLEEIEPIAITQERKLDVTSVDGIPFVAPEGLSDIEFDCIIVMSDTSFRDIKQNILDQGLTSAERVVSYKFMLLNGASASKYLELVKSRVSIIAMNCWGGLAYNTLGMECLSPFKNLFLEEGDYLKLLLKFHTYIDAEPEMYRNVTNKSGKTYPVLRIKDIYIHCNHSEGAKEAIYEWNCRKKRINTSNLFFMMYTDKKDFANRFSWICDERGYTGVCFVPWDPNARREIQIGEKFGIGKELWERVNDSATIKSAGYYYDLISILLGEDTYNERII